MRIDFLKKKSVQRKNGADSRCSVNITQQNRVPEVEGWQFLPDLHPGEGMGVNIIILLVWFYNIWYCTDDWCWLQLLPGFHYLSWTGCKLRLKEYVIATPLQDNYHNAIEHFSGKNKMQVQLMKCRDTIAIIYLISICIYSFSNQL